MGLQTPHSKGNFPGIDLIRAKKCRDVYFFAQKLLKCRLFSGSIAKVMILSLNLLSLSYLVLLSIIRVYVQVEHEKFVFLKPKMIYSLILVCRILCQNFPLDTFILRMLKLQSHCQPIIYSMICGQIGVLQSELI